jgi:hypothetical protein
VIWKYQARWILVYIGSRQLCQEPLSLELCGSTGNGISASGGGGGGVDEQESRANSCSSMGEVG